MGIFYLCFSWWWWEDEVEMILWWLNFFVYSVVIGFCNSFYMMWVLGSVYFEVFCKDIFLLEYFFELFEIIDIVGKSNRVGIVFIGYDDFVGGGVREKLLIGFDFKFYCYYVFLMGNLMIVFWSEVFMCKSDGYGWLEIESIGCISGGNFFVWMVCDCCGGDILSLE